MSEELSIDFLLTQVSTLPRGGEWEGPSRAALRDDLYSALTELTAAAWGQTSSESAEVAFEAWRVRQAQRRHNIDQTLKSLVAQPRAELAPLSVMASKLRALARLR